MSGAVWSGIQKFGLSFINFLSNIVLARLLTPDDYGCIGMLSIFIAVSNTLVYGGLGSALIWKKSINEEDLSTVFLWNLVVSVFLYVLLFVTASSIAHYYKIELLTHVLKVLGLVLIINGLGAIQITILQKDLILNKLAIINLLASFVSATVAILLALNGFGVWSLVSQQLLFSTICCVLLWIKSSWHPRMVFSVESFRSLFSYGSFLLLNDLVNTICDNLQGLLIGKKFAPSTMGYYTQAKKLEEVPTQSLAQVVNQVTFPIYSKIRDEKDRLYCIVKETMSLMNYVNFPLMMFLIVSAKHIFVFLYSDKWLLAVPYFQILCVAGIVNCLQSANYQVVSASGKTKELFLWNFIKRGIGVILMLLGLFMYGVEGLLWGMVAGFYVTYIINAQLAYSATGYSLWSQIKDNTPLFLISLISSIIVSIIPTLFSLSSFLLLMMEFIVFVIVYLFLSYLLKRTEVNTLITMLKVFLKKA